MNKAILKNEACPKAKDASGSHCDHWYNGGACCFCDAIPGAFRCRRCRSDLVVQSIDLFGIAVLKCDGGYECWKWVRCILIEDLPDKQPIEMAVPFQSKFSAAAWALYTSGLLAIRRQIESGQANQGKADPDAVDGNEVKQAAIYPAQVLANFDGFWGGQSDLICKAVANFYGLDSIPIDRSFMDSNDVERELRGN